MLIFAIGLLKICFVAIHELDIKLHGFREREVVDILSFLCEFFCLRGVFDSCGGVLDAKQVSEIAQGDHRKLRIAIVDFVEGLYEILFCPVCIVAGTIDVSHQTGGEVIVVYRLVLFCFGIKCLGCLYGSEQMILLDVVESLVGHCLIIRFQVIDALQVGFESMRMLIEGTVVALIV